MNKKKILSGMMALSVMLLITGCAIPSSSQKTANISQNTPNNNTNTKKDVYQDIKVEFLENGLTYEDYRIDVDNHEYENGLIRKGSELILNTYGVSGYEEIDGLVYPFLEHKVIDSKGKVVYEESDLIPDDIGGIDSETAQETYTYLDIDNSYKSGEIYQWVTSYSDRQGEANMDAIVYFMVE